MPPVLSIYIQILTCFPDRIIFDLYKILTSFIGNFLQQQLVFYKKPENLSVIGNREPNRQCKNP